MEYPPIRRAIISVFDKSGIQDFAKALHLSGIEILSTGGTADIIKASGIPVIEVSDFVDFPELFGGRVKTLHPRIFGGILAKRNGDDAQKAQEHNIPFIDLVVVNLYPFEETLRKEDVTEDEIIEMIDVGGPSLLRAGAKNFHFVTVVTDPRDYALVLDEMRHYGGTTLETRRKLALKAFEKTFHYDQAISDYFHGSQSEKELLDLHYEKVLSLRYGENPHQKAAFFRDFSNVYPNVTNAKILQGKQLSYNNILDTDSALKLVQDFNFPVAALIKHTNPCGVAKGETIDDAFMKAYFCDPKSAFGCVIALNRPCNEIITRFIQEQHIFVEIIAAPSFTQKALKSLKTRNNLRLLEVGDFRINPKERDIKSVGGGILVQNSDLSHIKKEDLKIVTQTLPTDEQIEDMLFARTVAKHVKSNAVVFAKNGVTTGIGAGQMSRVDSVWLAVHKGGENIAGSVMASDAFFPFADSVIEAHQAKLSAIIQPGGSVRDNEVILKADELGIPMAFTGIRSFKH